MQLAVHEEVTASPICINETKFSTFFLPIADERLGGVVFILAQIMQGTEAWRIISELTSPFHSMWFWKMWGAEGLFQIYLFLLPTA